LFIFNELEAILLGSTVEYNPWFPGASETGGMTWRARRERTLTPSGGTDCWLTASPRLNSMTLLL